MAHYNERLGTCLVCHEVVTADEASADAYTPLESWMTADERMVAAEKAGLAHLECIEEAGLASL